MNCSEEYALHNGLQIILYNMENVRTLSCGIWIRQGAKDETKETNGLSHFTEHLMFKINNKKSKIPIFETMINLKNAGIYHNATTTKDHTSFYTEGLAEDLDIMLKSLARVIWDKKPVEKDILEIEKEIVLREAEGYLMSSAQISDRVSQALWGNEYYGQSVIGTYDNIRNFSCEMVDQLIEERYIPNNSTLVIVGEFDSKQIREKIEEYFGGWKPKPKPKEILESIRKNNHVVVTDKNFGGNRSVVGVGFPAFQESDIRSQYMEIAKFALTMADSRLLHELRSKRGLVYGLKSFSNAFAKGGFFGIFFSANNAQVQEILVECLKEIERLSNEGIEADVLESLKKMRKVELLYSLQMTSTLLKHIGDYAMSGNFFSLDDELAQIASVNEAQMSIILKEVLQKEKMSIAALGSVDIKGMGIMN